MQVDSGADGADGFTGTDIGTGKLGWTGAANTASTRAPGEADMTLQGTLAAAASTYANTWGEGRAESRMTAQADPRTDPDSALLAPQKFRTTCPYADDDLTERPWAQKTKTQPAYGFYEESRAEEAAKHASEPTKTSAITKKFNAHAVFSLTRHPVGGTSNLKGKIACDDPVIPGVMAADSWLQDHKPGQVDPMRAALQRDLADLKDDPKKKGSKKSTDDLGDEEEGGLLSDGNESPGSGDD